VTTLPTVEALSIYLVVIGTIKATMLVALLILTMLTFHSVTDAYDEKTMLKKLKTYATQGYAFMDGLLPELRSDYMQDNIKVAMTLAKLAYLVSCEEHFVLSHNVNCSLVSYPTCRIKWPPLKGRIQARIREIKATSDNISKVDLNSDDALFEEGLKSVTCCIKETNKILGKNSTDDEGLRLPYIQFLNLHRTNKAVLNLALNGPLGKMAAHLLQEDRVRLYQTAIFQKSGNFNRTAVGDMLNRQTSWHLDLNMVPLDTSTGGYLTFWCPLTNIASSRNDSLLLFAKHSHRDISSTYWYHHIIGTTGDLQEKDMSLYNAIVNRYELAVYDQISVGSCTVHDGWMFHSANSQIIGSRDRVAIAFSFVSARARVLPGLKSTEKEGILRKSMHTEDYLSYKEWFHDLKANDVIDHPLLPLVYDATNPSFVPGGDESASVTITNTSASITEGHNGTCLGTGTTTMTPSDTMMTKKKIISEKAIRNNVKKINKKVSKETKKQQAISKESEKKKRRGSDICETQIKYMRKKRKF
jgi:hypothetical protein